MHASTENSKSLGVGARLYQLQSLRFLAAMLVVIGHVLMEMRQHDAFVSDRVYKAPWGSGVDIFFVISGFIIMFISRDQRTRSWRSGVNFLVRRALRIAPLYWLFTAAMMAAIILLPQSIKNSDWKTVDLIKSLAFIPVVNDKNLIRPILEQGWTLNFEAFFYLIFAIATVWFRQVYATIAIILTLFVIYGAFFGTTAPVLFQPYLLLFVAGMTIAYLYDHVKGAPSYIVALAFLASIAYVTAFGRAVNVGVLGHFFSWGIPAIIVVWAVVSWGAPPRWVNQGVAPLLGEASYALYLSHPFTVNILLILWQKAGFEVNLLFALAAITSSVAISLFVFLLIERPLLRWSIHSYRTSRLGRTLIERTPKLPADTVMLETSRHS